MAARGRPRKVTTEEKEAGDPKVAYDIGMEGELDLEPENREGAEEGEPSEMQPETLFAGEEVDLAEEIGSEEKLIYLEDLIEEEEEEEGEEEGEEEDEEEEEEEEHFDDEHLLLTVESLARYAPELLSIAQVMREEEIDFPELLEKLELLEENEVTIKELKERAIKQHGEIQQITNFIQMYDKQYVQIKFKELEVFRDLSIDMFGSMMIEIARDVEEADNRLSNVGTAEQIQAVLIEERRNGPKSAMKLAIQFLGDAGVESKKTRPVLSSIKANMMKLTELLRQIEHDQGKIFNKQMLQQFELQASE